MPGRPAAAPRVNFYIDGYNFYVPLSTLAPDQWELCWCDFLTLAKSVTKRLSESHPSEFGHCTLGAIKYFTATIPENMPKDRSGVERKHFWLDALHHHTRGRVEVVHGTFRPRQHRFYIERSELDNLVRGGIPINWDLLQSGTPTFHPHLKIHEEKQTDVMLAASLVTDAALGSAGKTPEAAIQAAPDHRSNTRPTPSACHAAVIISADIDFVPAAEMAARVFSCPVAIAFTFPHEEYNLPTVAPAHAHQIFTVEIAEAELRRSMLPRDLALPNGRKVELQAVKRSHFGRVRATGG